ncbi:MAG: NAD(P)-binding domain-containing protein [Leptospiraceae bacterium]|nr:NAD(P)-binding domain-containing protein [Leptospiraceae bacterium]MCP5502109.1 NAD(P)-binding domain-containing protein [Leptospiraceae bacterium]
MKIGILGSGIVGQTLAKGFLKYDYPVMVGSRDTSKLKEWQETEAPKAQLGSFAETARFGDMIVLAVKGTIAHLALEQAGKTNIARKIIIDATNPIAEEEPENGVLKFFTNSNSSLMEKLQEDFSVSRFVKAFSCVGSGFMVNPDFGGLRPTMFYCGNDESAKKEVKTILEKFGWEPKDMGLATSARAIEPLCILWCLPGFRENKWSHAFKLLQKI